MKGLLLTALGVTLMVGCAHGGAGRSERELRGLARVGGEGRVLVAGPASLVHANLQGTKTVTLFVVERVSGDDGDCAKRPAAQALPADATRAQVTVAAGHVLCAASASGPTDVSWHAHLDGNPNLWALR